MTNQLKLYPVWSNFIYFIAALYSIFISFRYKLKRLDRVLFFIFGVIILLTGAFSIKYHLTTPSWTNNQHITDTERFKKWLTYDQSFAIIVVIYALLFLIYRIVIHYYNNNHKGLLPLFYDSNFYLSILFIILSFVFYMIALGHHENATECNHVNCFHTNLDSYDIFHSNWHIFTSIGLIFWISMLKTSYEWVKNKT